jgi:multidrug transporter EmrE-like cation transporter
MAATAQPLWPFLLPVAGFVTYSLILKTLRPDVHPLLFLSIAYAAAFVIATIVWLVFGDMGSKLLQSRDVVWAVALGVALVVIEFGILLTLRNGWPVGVAMTAINVATATLLIGIGMALFKEKLSAVNMAGAVMCLGGLVLITRK